MALKMAMLDWRAMKYYQIRILIVPAFAFLFGLVYAPVIVLPTCVILCLMYSVNPFAVEEKGELDKLYLTLPVRRQDVVAGRFLLSLALGAFGAVMGFPLMLLANRIGLSHFYYPLVWNLFLLAFSYLLFAFLNLAMFPVLFRMGYCKGKFWGFILPAMFFGALYGAFTVIFLTDGRETLLMELMEFAGSHLLLLCGGMALLATALLALSFALSGRVYARREF